MDRYPRALSFGQKRRLGVATALALQPKTLILDEITNGQDEQEKCHMMAYLGRLQQERHMTLILITHDMDIARTYTTRALVLSHGDLVYDGLTAELFDGKRPIEAWGLKQPILSRICAQMKVTGVTTPEELCSKLALKGGEGNEIDCVYAPCPRPCCHSLGLLLPIPAVAMILALELVILLYIKRDRATMAAIGTLTVFTALMIIFQMLLARVLKWP